MPSLPTPIDEAHVHAVQQAWADAIVALGKAKLAGARHERLIALAEAAIDELYAFDHGPVLFKPTRAVAQPFRSTREGALSYFVGGEVAEDQGFALQPWTAVEFANDQIAALGSTALAMGHYTFTEAGTLRRVVAEYTFGYRRDPHGQLRIHLHHSSMPFSPPT